MKIPPRLELIGRGIIHPLQSGYGGKPARIARLESGFEGLGPMLAESPRLAAVLADICLSANLRDSVSMAQAIHRAEALLDSIGWDWGTASPIINPERRI